MKSRQDKVRIIAMLSREVRKATWKSISGCNYTRCDNNNDAKPFWCQQKSVSDWVRGNEWAAMRIVKGMESWHIVCC